MAGLLSSRSLLATNPRMCIAGVSQLLEDVVHCIREIDTECCSQRNGIEHGLVNVKLEFQDQAFKETGRRLTEELLIAWLLRKKLRGGARRSALPGNDGYEKMRSHCALKKPRKVVVRNQTGLEVLV